MFTRRKLAAFCDMRRLERFLQGVDLNARKEEMSALTVGNDSAGKTVRECGNGARVPLPTLAEFPLLGFRTLAKSFKPSSQQIGNFQYHKPNGILTFDHLNLVT